VLAGFGGRTPEMAILAEKVQLAAARGHGIIYFYWEGLWGQYAGLEGAEYRRQMFQQLHQAAFGAGVEGRGSWTEERGGMGRTGWRPPPPPSRQLLPPPSPPPLMPHPGWSTPWMRERPGILPPLP
jgi:hypothetical protein